MGTRGRKPASELSVISSNGIEAIQRPEPPRELTEEQSCEWRSIVNRMTADWFPRETHPALAQLCRHIVRARRIAQLLDAEESSAVFDFEEYRQLLASEETQSRAISALMRSMRLSQQSTYDKSKKKPPMGPKPWE